MFQCSEVNNLIRMVGAEGSKIFELNTSALLGKVLKSLPIQHRRYKNPAVYVPATL